MNWGIYLEIILSLVALAGWASFFVERRYSSELRKMLQDYARIVDELREDADEINSELDSLNRQFWFVVACYFLVAGTIIWRRWFKP